MNRTNCMAQHVEEYLALRRAFGFQLSIAGQQLQHFARFADRPAGGQPLTLELALRWSSSTGKQTTAARRLLILRPFTRYLRTLEPLTEIRPHQILGPAQYRYIPHIYTDRVISALLEAASGLRPRGGLRARSVGTYLRLLSCTDMRPAEPLRLTCADVDFPSHALTVRQTKFSKSRVVVLHPTAHKGPRRIRAGSRLFREISAISSVLLVGRTEAHSLIRKRWGPFVTCAADWAGCHGLAAGCLACTI